VSSDPSHVRGAPVDVVEENVAVGGRTLSILRPRDSEALLDEEAFEREEFLPYWAELWPSALALARAVAPLELAGARVLELGCGLGVPSLAAALAGARVLATDWSRDAVAFAAGNAHRNGIELETAVVSWADPGELVAGGPWKLVLAADVLYERRNVEQLLALLPQLVGGGSEVLLADPQRPHSGGFLREAAPAWRIESSPEPAPSRVVVHRLTRLSGG
jgi:predicted nicotinamide N-methyase